MVNPRARVDKMLNKKTKQNRYHLAHLWHFPLERVAPFLAGPLSQLQNFRLSRQSFPVETTLNRSHRVRTFPLADSIKCLQAISIELCFSMSNGTRPLCRSNADPSSPR